MSLYAKSVGQLLADTPSAVVLRHARIPDRACQATGTALAVLQNFDREAANWSDAPLSKLGVLVEAIVKAEAGRAKWNPKVIGSRYREVARSAAAAARAAKLIADGTSEPSLESRSLVGQLADFVAAAAGESGADYFVETVLARRLLKDFRDTFPQLRLSNVLLADLANIARDGSSPEIDESAIRRRYVPSARDSDSKRWKRDVPVKTIPALKEWNRNWKLVKAIVSLPESKSERSPLTRAAFASDIRARLTSS
jgi:hypothetical protein